MQLFAAPAFSLFPSLEATRPNPAAPLMSRSGERLEVQEAPGEGCDAEGTVSDLGLEVIRPLQHPGPLANCVLALRELQQVRNFSLETLVDALCRSLATHPASSRQPWHELLLQQWLHPASRQPAEQASLVLHLAKVGAMPIAAHGGLDSAKARAFP